jgi:hypothetical protein
VTKSMAKGAVVSFISLMTIDGLCIWCRRTEVKEDSAGDGHADGLAGLGLTSLYSELVPSNHSKLNRAAEDRSKMYLEFLLGELFLAFWAWLALLLRQLIDTGSVPGANIVVYMRSEK